MLDKHDSIQQQYPDTNPQEIIAALVAVMPTSNVIKAKDADYGIQTYTFPRLG